MTTATATTNLDAVAAAVARMVETFDERALESGDTVKRAMEHGFRSGVLRMAESLAYQITRAGTPVDRLRFFSACGLALAANGHNAEYMP